MLAKNFAIFVVWLLILVRFFLEIRIYKEIYYSNKSDFVKTRKKISFTLNFSSLILAFSSSKKFF